MVILMPDIKPLKYAKLNGLSEKQLKEHHDVLYAGYCKKVDEIHAKLKTVDKSTANASYSDLRELKVEETFAVNGVRLHEYYFDNMVPNNNALAVAPSGVIAEWIVKDFGGLQAWVDEFKACGLAARGWVVLALDLEDGKLHNYVCDTHNQGGVWNTVAVLVMDVFEHAYFIDYATGRKAYIEAFMKEIDWAEVNKRIEKMSLNKFRK
ncbi:MAG: Fe-Mn family superoxide dismutase [Candidatus Woesearchaeota archaeon]|nr:Fe-Mn family superoxide dismutase [Candidatus Woesearchaeota archaeon]